MADWELRKKVARMALGWDNYELVKGKAEVFPAKESKDYVDKLTGFHKDVMKFLRSLDVYSTSDRLTKAKQLHALMKRGEAIEEYD
jgi:hypothetical protein